MDKIKEYLKKFSLINLSITIYYDKCNQHEFIIIIENDYFSQIKYNL
jgi:hypothetical protein